MGGACSAHVEMRNACNILVRKPEGSRPLGRPRCVWRIILKCILGAQCFRM
jgi:hypothetical protein